MTRYLRLSVLVLSVAIPTTARAQLSVDEERGVQVAAMSTAYAFGALHTALGVLALARGEPLERSWIAGTFMSAISFIGLSIGYITQAVAFSSDPDEDVAYAMSAPPGIIIGSLDLALGIDSIYRGQGGLWMKPAPAIVTLIQGLALSTFGWVLTTNGSPETSDLENVLPIYTWAVTGALLAIYSVLSLFMTSD